jgi:hypothetical protein
MARGALDNTAIIAFILAEQSRDHDEHPNPFTAHDFNPLRSGQGSGCDVMPYSPKVLEALNKKGIT